ncbi:hypothetical protein BB560_005632 [Smittium megazygosporum]|uniref:AB hydrolase-1 domain-containing protein n=1 Tax=Smittium megazygosporum TaxID=133381 RepID=A0A2T9Z227_9FUNG|nr:hypothetical protein BB560_005632 [Smittium megazygosporum]
MKANSQWNIFPSANKASKQSDKQPISKSYKSAPRAQRKILEKNVICWLDSIQPDSKGYCSIGKTDKNKSIKIYYEVYGNGPVKIMLVMGMVGTSDYWKMQVLHFIKDPKFQTCIYDNRGAGKSTNFAGLYSTTDLAKDLITLIKYLGWSKNINLLGVSLGGMVVQKACLLTGIKPHKLLHSSTDVNKKDNIFHNPRNSMISAFNRDFDDKDPVSAELEDVFATTETEKPDLVRTKSLPNFLELSRCHNLEAEDPPLVFSSVVLVDTYQSSVGLVPTKKELMFLLASSYHLYGNLSPLFHLTFSNSWLGEAFDFQKYFGSSKEDLGIDTISAHDLIIKNTGFFKSRVRKSYSSKFKKLFSGKSSDSLLGDYKYMILSRPESVSVPPSRSLAQRSQNFKGSSFNKKPTTAPKKEINKRSLPKLSKSKSPISGSSLHNIARKASDQKDSSPYNSYLGQPRSYLADSDINSNKINTNHDTTDKSTPESEMQEQLNTTNSKLESFQFTETQNTSDNLNNSNSILKRYSADKNQALPSSSAQLFSSETSRAGSKSRIHRDTGSSLPDYSANRGGYRKNSRTLYKSHHNINTSAARSKNTYYFKRARSTFNLNSPIFLSDKESFEYLRDFRPDLLNERDLNPDNAEDETNNSSNDSSALTFINKIMGNKPMLRLFSSHYTDFQQLMASLRHSVSDKHIRSLRDLHPGAKFLVIGGTRDSVIRRSNFRILAKNLNTIKVFIENAAHMPLLDSPISFNSILESFINEDDWLNISKEYPNKYVKIINKENKPSDSTLNSTSSSPEVLESVVQESSSVDPRSLRFDESNRSKSLTPEDLNRSSGKSSSPGLVSEKTLPYPSRKSDEDPSGLSSQLKETRVTFYTGLNESPTLDAVAESKEQETQSTSEHQNMGKYTMSSKENEPITSISNSTTLKDSLDFQNNPDSQNILQSASKVAYLNVPSASKRTTPQRSPSIFDKVGLFFTNPKHLFNKDSSKKSDTNLKPSTTATTMVEVDISEKKASHQNSTIPLTAENQTAALKASVSSQDLHVSISSSDRGTSDKLVSQEPINYEYANTELSKVEIEPTHKGLEVDLSEQHKKTPSASEKPISSKLGDTFLQNPATSDNSPNKMAMESLKNLKSAQLDQPHGESRHSTSEKKSQVTSVLMQKGAVSNPRDERHLSVSPEVSSKVNTPIFGSLRIKPLFSNSSTSREPKSLSKNLTQEKRPSMDISRTHSTLLENKSSPSLTQSSLTGVFSGKPSISLSRSTAGSNIGSTTTWSNKGNKHIEKEVLASELGIELDNPILLKDYRFPEVLALNRPSTTFFEALGVGTSNKSRSVSKDAKDIKHTKKSITLHNTGVHNEIYSYIL